MQARCWVQIGSLTLRKLRDLEKESGMTGSKDGGSSKKAEPKEEVSSWLSSTATCNALWALVLISELLWMAQQLL